MNIHAAPSRERATGLAKLQVRQHRWWRPLLWAGLAALAMLAAWQVATSGALLAADPIALSEPWRFVDESKPGAPAISGELAVASAGAPVEVAARFAIHSSMQALALQLHNADLAGLPLGDVDDMRYCTRLVDGPRPYAVTLQLNVDADVTDDNRNWQGRLVYTPSHNGAVVQGEWQCWNVLAGKWWATGEPIASLAPAGDPQPLATLLAHFPNLGINQAYAAITLKAGDGWTYFQGEAGPVEIEVAGRRFEMAFGAAPAGQQENEVLLPVLFNESQGTASGDDRAESDDNGKDGKKDKNEKKDKPDNKQWRAADWDDLTWEDFTWRDNDWDKLDWDKLDWVAFGWYGVRGETIRAFVEDVKQCRGEGWAALGFAEAGDCVAYFAKSYGEQARQSSYRTWDNFEWDRDWSPRSSRD